MKHWEIKDMAHISKYCSFHLPLPNPRKQQVLTQSILTSLALTRHTFLPLFYSLQIFPSSSLSLSPLIWYNKKWIILAIPTTHYLSSNKNNKFCSLEKKKNKSPLRPVEIQDSWSVLNVLLCLHFTTAKRHNYQ